MIDRIKKFLQNHLKPNQTVIIGISGGADSMCLLHILSEMDFRIIAAHVNYQLRGEDSNLDEQLVRKTCGNLEVKFELLRTKIKKHGNMEEQARNIRYDFFEKIRIKHDAEKILIAHNQDDQLETILFQMFRGAGRRGEVGMEKISGNILRPMLGLPKKEIRKFCKRKKIVFREDKTNFNKTLARNRLRNEIIPALNEIFPKFQESFLKNAQAAKQEDDFLDSLAKFSLKKIGEGEKAWQCSRETWNTLDPVIQKRIIRILHLEKFKTLSNVRRKHIDEIVELLSQAPTGKKRKFGKGEWRVKKGFVTFG